MVHKKKNIYMYIIIAPIPRSLYAIRIKRLEEYIIYLTLVIPDCSYTVYHYLPPKDEKRRVSRLDVVGVGSET